MYIELCKLKVCVVFAKSTVQATGIAALTLFSLTKLFIDEQQKQFAELINFKIKSHKLLTDKNYDKLFENKFQCLAFLL